MTAVTIEREKLEQVRDALEKSADNFAANTQHIQVIAMLDEALARPEQPAQQESVAWVEQIMSAFPLLNDEGLDEEKHHCEWAIQQDRKRLHAMLKTIPPQRKPLPLSRMVTLTYGVSEDKPATQEDLYKLIRQVEAYHGIKE